MWYSCSVQTKLFSLSLPCSFMWYLKLLSLIVVLWLFCVIAVYQCLKLKLLSCDLVCITLNLINCPIWHQIVEEDSVSLPWLYFQTNTLLIFIPSILLPQIEIPIYNPKTPTHNHKPRRKKQWITSNGNIVSPPSSTLDKYNKKDASCIQWISDQKLFGSFKLN